MGVRYKFRVTFVTIISFISVKDSRTYGFLSDLLPVQIYIGFVCKWGSFPWNKEIIKFCFNKFRIHSVNLKVRSLTLDNDLGSFIDFFCARIISF
jgi:hypothetical protein